MQTFTRVDVPIQTLVVHADSISQPLIISTSNTLVGVLVELQTVFIGAVAIPILYPSICACLTVLIKGSFTMNVQADTLD